MYRSVIVIGLIFTLGATSAGAKTSFRVPRPTETSRLSENDDEGLSALQAGDNCMSSKHIGDKGLPDPHIDAISGAHIDDSGLLGQYIYANLRTAMPRSSFEIWRQEYCDPFLCTMVLCNGSCKVFAEHCPSLSDSARVIHINESGCMSDVQMTSRRTQSAYPTVADRNESLSRGSSKHKSADSNECCKRKKL